MLKTDTRLSRCCAAGLAGLLLTLNAAALAGNLDAPAGPTDADSAMFTLQDLCNRLASGAAGAKRSGPFAEPTAGPAATMCTLNDIMTAMPTINASGAGVADVLAGKTFWGLLTGGGWGLKTGTATAGANVTGTDGNLSMTIPDGLYSGSKTATASDTDLITANIITGKTIFGVDGSAVVATGNAAAGDVLITMTFSNVGGSATGSMPNNGAVTITPTTTAQSIAAGYHNGSGAVTGDANLTSTNIKKDTVIFGVTGTYESPPCNCSGGTLNGTRWCDNGDGTVTDLLGSNLGVPNGKVKGQCLVWLKNANCSANLASINKTGTLNWLNAVIWSSAVKSTVCGLTDSSMEGDWRLPTKTELWVLTQGAEAVLASDPRAFTDVQSELYWSSTTFAPITGNAWGVDLSDGFPGANGKTDAFHVWPVRDGL